MSNAMRQPVIVIFAVFIGLVFLVILLFALSSTGGPVSSGVSTGLASAGNEGINLLPWIAIIVSAGLVFLAMELRRN